MSDNGNHQHPPRPRTVFQGLRRDYLYVPVEDITAYEAAQVMEVLVFGIGVGIGKTPPQALDMLYESLPPEVQRHFRIHEKSQIVVPR